MATASQPVAENRWLGRLVSWSSRSRHGSMIVRLGGLDERLKVSDFVCLTI